MCVLLPSLLLVMNNLDNRFNIYIYDYCFKRGYRKTARELLAEAEIPPDSIPPINARQGLLFECVFFFALFYIITIITLFSFSFSFLHVDSDIATGGGVYFGFFSRQSPTRVGRKMGCSIPRCVV